MADQRILYFFSTVQARRPVVIRQLLINKRTVSNLFWGLEYQLLDWLAVAPNLNKVYFEQQIDQLQHSESLKVVENGVILTPSGFQQWQKYQAIHYWRQAPLLVQQYQVRAWKKMLALLIQVFSEMTYHNPHYYVNITDPQLQYWLKRWLRHFSRQQLQQEFVRTLTTFLIQKPQLVADVFLNMFSGHQVAGQTLLQLQQQTGWTVGELNCLLSDFSLQLAEKLLTQGPAWQELIKLFRLPSRLTASSVRSYQLFLKRQTVAEIARQRKLKVSTIQEHLLEAAIFENDFPYQHILSTEIQRQLLVSFPQSDLVNWNYQVVNQLGIPFFQFRLFQIQQLKQKKGGNLLVNKK
ncbi:MAG: helix-turn-helix domain-containing protein [Liquorilactobacillus nagelii]|uniref:helix-turn-helix domain-containing protein n=1 Tax=Liquorilactobacillus nagelii TaxID=82688 RepID=UPI0039E8ABE8